MSYVPNCTLFLYFVNKHAGYKCVSFFTADKNQGEVLRTTYMSHVPNCTLFTIGNVQHIGDLYVVGSQLYNLKKTDSFNAWSCTKRKIRCNMQIYIECAILFTNTIDHA